MRIRRASLISLAALPLLLVAAWRVLTLGMADHYASEQPQRALQWRLGHADALLAAATRSGTQNAPGDTTAYAHRALRANPLQGVAYRALAANAATDSETARLYALAATRSPRDIPSLAWLTEHALAAEDHAAALRHIDQILRVEPGALAALYPAIEYLASQPVAQAELAGLFEHSPPWRTGALLQLAQRAPEVAAVAPVFERLRTSRRGLDRRELGAWLDRLLKAREWQWAYLFWASELPATQRERIGNVFDGGFEWTPSNLGFGWRIARIAGATIDRSATDGISGSSALRIAFDYQRVAFNHVSQLMALPAGNYRFEGRVRLDGLQTARGLVWSLSCAEGNTALASTPTFSGHRPWHPFSVDFAIPTAACGGQWLRLHLPARIPAEQYVGGTIWFDDLRILRRD